MFPFPKGTLTAAMVAVAISLENAALAVAVVAFLTAGLALAIVNRRLDEFADVTNDTQKRLESLERTVPKPPFED